MRVLCLPIALGAFAIACAGAAPPAPEPPPAPPPAPPASASAPAPAAETSACAPRRDRAITTTSRSGSTLVLEERPNKRLLYAADEENHAIHTLDADSLAELAVTELAGRPAQILPLRDGRLLVTLRDRNRLLVMDPGDQPERPIATLCERPTYTDPFGLAVSPDGARVALTAGFDHRLSLLDARTLDSARTIDLPAEPRGVMLSGDGETAYVAHLVGGAVSVVDVARQESAVQRIFVRPPKPKTEAQKGKAAPKPINPSQELAAAQGFAIAEIAIGGEGDKAWPARVFAPMASSDPMRFGAEASFPSTYGGGGGGVAVIGAFVAVIDPKAKAPLGAEAVKVRESRPEDCILPRAMAVHERRLFVACMGTDMVVELDANAADPISTERARYRVGAGPTGLVIDAANKRALVLSDWSGEITAIDLAPDAKGASKRLRLAHPDKPALSAELARGRKLFYATRDVRMSFDGRACASCHPEGRADGLTWATPDGPRQTIVLAGRADRQGPFGWFGDHPVMKNHVSLTVERLHGSGFHDRGGAEDFAALLAYVRSLRLPSRAGAIVDEGVEAQRARGRELFYAKETDCSTCHLGDATDAKHHDVGSGDPHEKHRFFATPALRGVGASAPYFHDGRYATLLDLLSDPNSKMGRSANLSPEDRRALAAYLESL
jgi:mono/diheme cytochrome c family protein